MIKTFILAGIVTTLLACNSHSNRDSSAEHSGHTSHKKATDNKTGHQTNLIQEAMNNMMQAMHGAKSTGNNDVDFAAMMIEHHRGAVAMAKVEIGKGSNAELKAFAEKVISDQEKEVSIMQEVITKAPGTASPNSADFQKALNSSMMTMMSDTTATYHDLDMDFAAQMIPHHQSAVDMAKAYLAFGRDADLRTLCQNIIHSQTKEINWLKVWLARQGE